MHPSASSFQKLPETVSVYVGHTSKHTFRIDNSTKSDISLGQLQLVTEKSTNSAHLPSQFSATCQHSNPYRLKTVLATK